MAKFLLRLYGQVLSEFDLKKERVTIGRLPDNDIAIKSPAISGHHAVAYNLARQTFLQDLESTNGTFVNGERINRQVLKNGDVVTVGKHELLYEALEEEIAKTEDDAFDKTVVIRSTLTKKLVDPPTRPSPAVVGASSHSASEFFEEPTVKTAKVVIVSGPDTGKSFAFTKEVTAFGKKGVQVATVTQKSDGYYLTFVEGNGSPSINGHSIGQNSQRLKENDVLEVAGIKMLFMVG